MASKDVKLYYKQALTLLGKGEFDKSLKLLDMILNIDKEFIPAWNSKGIAHLEKREYPESLNSFEQVIQLDAGDNLAWYNKGYVLLLMDEFEESKKIFDFFLAQYEKKNGDFYKFALYLRAKSYYGLKDYESAIISVDNAIKMDDKFKEALELKKAIHDEMDKK
ncbi:MAG TPA: tetratricopeptide repeat protein [Methanobacterium sp.]